MRLFKVLAIVLVVYAAIVAAFESMIGYFQPAPEGTLVITTFDEDGAGHERVVSRLESGDQLYVAVNHWPRAWYGRALENPEVRVEVDGEIGDYTAVPVTGAEAERVDEEHALGPVFRFFTGYAPRYFLRLDPRPSASG